MKGVDINVNTYDINTYYAIIFMPKTSKEIEKIILKDGWILEKSNHGSHRKYYHPYKTGKVTIPFHNKDLSLKTLISICKQAQIDWRKYK